MLKYFSEGEETKWQEIIFNVVLRLHRKQKEFQERQEYHLNQLHVEMRCYGDDDDREFENEEEYFSGT